MGRRPIGLRLILLQDSDTNHTASASLRAVLQRKEEQGALVVTVWPSRSPDLNNRVCLGFHDFSP